ncbi:MAG: hypothetical protein N838_01285 [Thiohalocapsa sp. PB-PSB1]|jgi:hypothetical protein|nr:MAG: hypothetical protein N838_01285 [Thiohalocapsa sp. PB-PSB1]
MQPRPVGLGQRLHFGDLRIAHLGARLGQVMGHQLWACEQLCSALQQLLD